MTPNLPIRTRYKKYLDPSIEDKVLHLAASQCQGRESSASLQRRRPQALLQARSGLQQEIHRKYIPVSLMLGGCRLPPSLSPGLLPGRQHPQQLPPRFVREARRRTNELTRTTPCQLRRHITWHVVRLQGKPPTNPPAPRSPALLPDDAHRDGAAVSLSCRTAQVEALRPSAPRGASGQVGKSRPPWVKAVTGSFAHADAALFVDDSAAGSVRVLSKTRRTAALFATFLRGCVVAFPRRATPAVL